MALKIVEGCSGFGIVSGAFEAGGHRAHRVEILERFQADHRDLMTLTPAIIVDRLGGTPDGFWFSTPCTSYSMMSVGTHWTHDGQPKTDTARMGRDLILKGLDLVRAFPDAWFVFENPRARLRTLPFLEGIQRFTVSYCQYGENRMKPTDLWIGGGLERYVNLKPICKNGAPCHVAAPRGSRTGTQGMDKAECAKIPLLLAQEIVRAAEAMAADRVAVENE